MENIETQDILETIENRPTWEACRYEGPTVIIDFGIQMEAKDYDERMSERAAVMAEILIERTLNRVIGNTLPLQSGGYTGKTNEMGSEAEIMLLGLDRHINHLLETKYKSTGMKLSVYGTDTSLIDVDNIQYPLEIAPNHWSIPVYMDKSASSTTENFETLNPIFFDHPDVLFSLIAGSARPSAFRAATVANMLYPNSKIEAIPARDKPELERIISAIKHEGSIMAGAQEMFVVEAALTMLTRLGAGEFLNKFTQSRIKN